MRRLLPLAEPGIDEEGAMLVQSPRLAAGILRGLRQDPDAVLRDTNGRSLQDVFIGLALVLVAVNADDEVVGVLMAFPPVRVLFSALQAGVSMTEVLAAARTVVKIKAVAVMDLARGQGLGAALLDQCVRLYSQLGWRVLYGQFGAESGLDSYYTRQGFEARPRRS